MTEELVLVRHSLFLLSSALLSSPVHIRHEHHGRIRSRCKGCKSALMLPPLLAPDGHKRNERQEDDSARYYCHHQNDREVGRGGR